ncbi:MAG: META domain-containing protein [Acidimicrobiia bacterium]
MSSRRVVRIPLFALLLVLVLGGALAACSDDGNDKGSTTSSGQADITGVQWTLDKITPDGPSLGSVVVTAQFADGRMSGDSGCNRYTASYTAKPSTGSMKIGPVAGTRIACEGAANDVEQAYLAALDKVQQYRATSDSLRLLDAGGKVLLQYSATDGAQALQGDWEVTSFYTGSALSSPVAGSTLTAKFDGKQISGDAGCNTFSGSYTIDGENITIGTLASTTRACADPAVDAQEAQYLQALSLAKTFAVSGDRLDLFREGGTFAASFQKK